MLLILDIVGEISCGWDFWWALFLVGEIFGRYLKLPVKLYNFLCEAEIPLNSKTEQNGAKKQLKF